MSTKLAFLVFLITLTFLLLGNITNLRNYREHPGRDLAMQAQIASIEIDTLNRRGTLKEVEQKRLYMLRGQIMKINAETTIRRYHLDQVATILMILALFMLVAARLRSRTARLTSKQKSALHGLNVEEASPREQYIDEWDLAGGSEGGFKRKEEAIRWLQDDPMLVCGYCGERLRSTFTGQRESVQLTTFYKKVPDGARDLRVVLGSFWFPRHATELRCSKCGHAMQR